MIPFAMVSRLSHSIEILQTAATNGLHFSGQLIAVYNGQEALSHVFGVPFGAQTPSTHQTQYLWMSSGKPVTAVALGLLVDRGAVNWSTPVAEILPEFGNRGKEAITLGHILSQSAALRGADRVEAANTHDILEQISRLPLDEGQIPGQHAGYHIGGTWLVLGEVVHRLTGTPLPQFLQTHVFTPCGMTDSHLGLSPGTKGPVPMMDTTKSPPRIHPVYGTDAALSIPRPGRNLFGPLSDLVAFYQTLRAVLKGKSSFLQKSTLETMIVPQRPPGQRDLTFGHPADFGYGFYLHPDKYGKGKSSYGYGQYASASSFGHSGAQSSCAFYDPECDLIAAWVVDGMPGEPRHQRRARAINEALYRDLDLTHPSHDQLSPAG